MSKSSTNKSRDYIDLITYQEDIMTNLQAINWIANEVREIAFDGTRYGGTSCTVTTFEGPEATVVLAQDETRGAALIRCCERCIEQMRDGARDARYGEWHWDLCENLEKKQRRDMEGNLLWNQT